MLPLTQVQQTQQGSQRLQICCEGLFQQNLALIAQFHWVIEAQAPVLECAVDFRCGINGKCCWWVIFIIFIIICWCLCQSIPPYMGYQNSQTYRHTHTDTHTQTHTHTAFPSQHDHLRPKFQLLGWLLIWRSGGIAARKFVVEKVACSGRLQTTWSLLLCHVKLGGSRFAMRQNMNADPGCRGIPSVILWYFMRGFASPHIAMFSWSPCI